MSPVRYPPGLRQLFRAYCLPAVQLGRLLLLRVESLLLVRQGGRHPAPVLCHLRGHLRILHQVILLLFLLVLRPVIRRYVQPHFRQCLLLNLRALQLPIHQ